MTQGTNGAFFRKGKQNFAQANIDWDTGSSQTFDAMLFDLSDWGEAFGISNVVNNGSECQVTTASVHGLTTGDRVHVTGVDGAVEANGTWVVTVLDTTNFTLDGSTTPTTYVASSDDFMIRLDNEEFVNDLDANVVEETQALTVDGNHTSLLGVLDSSDITFTAAAGDKCHAIAIARSDTPAGTNDQLICIITEATGLPVILNGGDVTVAWDNGANKIAAL